MHKRALLLSGSAGKLPRVMTTYINEGGVNMGLFDRKKKEEIVQSVSEEKDSNTVEFDHNIHDVVMISVSGEVGEIVGRAEREYDLHEYLVRYKDANGCAVERWWNENAIEETNQ